MNQEVAQQTRPSQGVDEHTFHLPHAHPGCLRCGGFLVVEHGLDLLNSTGQVECQALRCVQCGDVIDAVILRHRQMQHRLESSSVTAAFTFIGVGAGKDSYSGPIQLEMR